MSQPATPTTTPPVPARSAAKKTERLVWMIAIPVGLVFLVVVAIGMFGGGLPNLHSSADDVTLTGCSSQQLLGSTSGLATVLVHNNGTSAADYLVKVSFMSEDGGTQYDTATASVDDLGAGQSETAQATGFRSVPDGSFRCKVLSVSRF